MEVSVTDYADLSRFETIRFKASVLEEKSQF